MVFVSLRRSVVVVERRAFSKVASLFPRNKIDRCCCRRRLLSTTSNDGSTSETTTTAVKQTDNTNRKNTYSQSAAPPPWSSSSDTIITKDVLIVGGGVVGCSLARLLLRQYPNLSVGLVDAGPAPRCTGTQQQDETTSSPPTLFAHPRSYALSPASLEILGLTKKHRPLAREESSTHGHHHGSRIGFYDSMQVWEANQPASLIFTSEDLKNDEDAKCPHLGAVVEDSVLREFLWSEINDGRQEQFHSWNETTVDTVEWPTAENPYDPVGVELIKPRRGKDDDGDSDRDRSAVRTRLLVAADGAKSSIRNMAGIGDAEGSSLDYGLSALTFTVKLNESHGKRAFQRFDPSGAPMALLPTFDEETAIVVWSTTPQIVQQYKGSNNEELLVQHVNAVLQEGPQRLPPLFSQGGTNQQQQNPLWTALDKLVETAQYGPALAAQEFASAPFRAPPAVEAIVSPQFSFPLSCRRARHYTMPPPNNNTKGGGGGGLSRLALVGDACHSVHPLAGQGLNLGLQDVRALIETIGLAANAGMDVATFVRSRYEPGRQLQVSATLQGIHAVQRLFAGPNNDDDPIRRMMLPWLSTGTAEALSKHAKSVGMNVVQNLVPLRRALVQAACYGVSVPGADK